MPFFPMTLLSDCSRRASKQGIKTAIGCVNGVCIYYLTSRKHKLYNSSSTILLIEISIFSFTERLL
jgi:hypothetical protein